MYAAIAWERRVVPMTLAKMAIIVSIGVIVFNVARIVAMLIWRR